MKPAEKIENLIKERRYKASAETYDKALGSFLQAVDEHIKQKSAQTRPKIWRKIVNSRITKLATAAVIIIAAYVIIHQSGGSIDGTSVAYAKMTENMKKMPWLHGIVEGKQGSISSQRLESWVSFDSKISISVTSSGEITFIDYSKQILGKYDPKTNTVTKSHCSTDDLLVTAGSPLKFWEGMVKQLEEMEAEVTVEVSMLKNIEKHVYRVESSPFGGPMEVNLTVDTRLSLPVLVSQKIFTPEGKLTMEASASFDYPEKGPESIYDVGVPKSAKVIDNLPSKEVTEILKLYRSHRESAPSIYIAVVQETRFHSKDNTPTWHGVSIVYKNGIKQRVNEFRIPTSQRNMGWSKYLIIIGREMGNTFDSQFLWWEKNGLLSSVQLYDGKYQYDANKQNDKWIRRPKQYSPGGDLRADNDLADLGWSDLADLGWSVHFVSPYQGCGPFTIIEDDYSLENGLICMETKAQGRISDNGWAVLPTRIITYLNPQRDYICQRYEKHDVFDAPWQTKYPRNK